jgi:hypothetical protein
MGSLRARSTCHAPEKFARRAAFEFAGDGDKGGDDDGDGCGECTGDAVGARRRSMLPR